MLITNPVAHLTGAGAAGEDIAAETFRVALDSRRRFDRSRVDAGPWLFGIATNLLRRRLRSETRRTRAGSAAPSRRGRPGRWRARPDRGRGARSAGGRRACSALPEVSRCALAARVGRPLLRAGRRSHPCLGGHRPIANPPRPKLRSLRFAPRGDPSTDGNYLEWIWLDATTGVPIQEKDGDNSATAYAVERVTAARLPAVISSTARLR